MVSNVERLKKLFGEFRKGLGFPTELERLSQPIHDLEAEAFHVAEKLDKCLWKLTKAEEVADKVIDERDDLETRLGRVEELLKNQPDFDDLAKEFPDRSLTYLAGVWVERAKKTFKALEKAIK